MINFLAATLSVLGFVAAVLSIREAWKMRREDDRGRLIS